MENELTRYKDIIMFGMQPWDIEIGGNFKNMALEMSGQYRVLYVNRPLDRITALREKSDTKTINRLNSIKKNIGVLQEVKENLWVFNPQTMIESINWLPPGKIYTLFNKRNNKKLALEIKKAMHTLGIQDALLIIDNDFYNGLYLKEFLGVDCVMYYLRDYLLSQPYFYKHGKISEPSLMSKADIVTTNSSYLAEYAKAYNANTYYIGQGCEVEEFAAFPASIPDDINQIEKPVIGYCGALLNLRLDIDLLIKIAEQRPQWNFVFIGPEDDDFKKSRLHQLPNVYFLGHRDPDKLPAYVHYFDVCINPQVINQMTIGNYPRKVDEYLAAGKAVVATATKAMEEFADVTYLCTNADEYLFAIEEALSKRNDTLEAEKRVAVAKSHTWKNSVMKLYASVNKFVQTKNHAGRI